MNYIYTINAGDRRGDISFAFSDMLEIFKHSLKNVREKYELVVSDKVYRQGACYSKIRGLLDCNFKDGDKILIMDLDMYILSDPFACFESEFDVGVTVRKYLIPTYPVNAGFIALRWSRRVEAFVLQWCSEMLYATNWIMRQFNRMPGRGEALDLWCDQDYLNSAFLFGTPEIKFYDIGYGYNYCTVKDGEYDVAEAMKEVEDNIDYISVVHCKGHLKPMMTEMENVYG